MSKETKSGFKFEIDEASLDSWEIVEAIDEMEEHPERIVTVAKAILGKEQYNALKKHCTDEDGNIKFTTMSAEIEEIMESHNDTKNS